MSVGKHSDRNDATARLWCPVTNHSDAHDRGVDAPIGVGLDGIQQPLLIIGTVHGGAEVGEEHHPARGVAMLPCMRGLGGIRDNSLYFMSSKHAEYPNIS